MVYGLWFMVYGLWFMVYGLWFLQYIQLQTTNTKLQTIKVFGSYFLPSCLSMF